MSTPTCSLPLAAVGDRDSEGSAVFRSLHRGGVLVVVLASGVALAGCSSSARQTASTSSPPPATSSTPATTQTGHGIVLRLRNTSGNLSSDQFTSLAKALKAALATSPAVASLRTQIWQIGHDELEIRVQGSAGPLDLNAVIRAAQTSQHLQLSMESAQKYSEVSGASTIGGDLTAQNGTIAFSPTSRTDTDLSKDAAAIRTAATTAGFTGWLVEHVGDQTGLAVYGGDASAANSFLLALAAQAPYSSVGPSTTVYSLRLLASL